MKPEALRTIYLPRMSDHALTVAAAMRAVGLEAEALPEPDERSMATGLSVCRGTECLPCFLCAGDFLRKCREPGFDPRRAIFFLPTGPGPCRFGQYRVLQKAILAEQGFGDVPIVSPTTDDSYALFGDDPVRLRKLSWQGVVAVDLLTRVLHEHRPYEVVPSSSDRAYSASLEDVVRAIEAGGGAHATRALARAATRFGGVETRGRQSRPAVAVIGELYLMLNRTSNLELVRAVERAGGEVLQGTFSDWLYFVDWRRKDRALHLRRYGDYLNALASEAYEKRIERRFARTLRTVLHRPADAPVKEAVKPLRVCWEPALGTEATLTMARILDVARHGLSGIVNVLPFSCMPGSVVACLGPRLRRERNGIPWLDVAFDAQKETNLQTRLEAFMHQAARYHRRIVEGRGEEMMA
jgi:predicted nucleotide-binding protein (sugar kinase/HSP70/actin superfamily)